MFWEDEVLDHKLHKCGCECPACYHGCTGRTLKNGRRHDTLNNKDPFQKLPRATFALAVDENIYKQVLDEIDLESSMPCGLFYCGHHEDVDHPSIFIPVIILLTLFLAMVYVAFAVQA